MENDQVQILLEYYHVPELPAVAVNACCKWSKDTWHAESQILVESAGIQESMCLKMCSKYSYLSLIFHSNSHFRQFGSKKKEEKQTVVSWSVKFSRISVMHDIKHMKVKMSVQQPIKSLLNEYIKAGKMWKIHLSFTESKYECMRKLLWQCTRNIMLQCGIMKCTIFLIIWINDTCISNIIFLFYPYDFMI